jgi:hypothetical protein
MEFGITGRTHEHLKDIAQEIDAIQAPKLGQDIEIDYVYQLKPMFMTAE